MSAIVHGLLQHAKLTAENASYQIRPGQAGGWVIWTRDQPIKSIALFNSRDDAEQFIFGQIAVMGDDA